MPFPASRAASFFDPLESRGEDRRPLGFSDLEHACRRIRLGLESFLLLAAATLSACLLLSRASATSARADSLFCACAFRTPQDIAHPELCMLPPQLALLS